MKNLESKITDLEEQKEVEIASRARVEAELTEMQRHADELV